jgi:hypothetical protein
LSIESITLQRWQILLIALIGLAISVIIIAVCIFQVRARDKDMIFDEDMDDI